jgi:hypothetical protein
MEDVTKSRLQSEDEALEVKQQGTSAATAETEGDGLVFKRELLNEFLGNRVRS